MPAQPSRPKSLRLAITLNLLLPGAGQIYLGQMTPGLGYAGGFLMAFTAMLTLFLRAYANYLQLSTSGDLLAGDNLEQLARSFPVRWLIGLLILAVVVYLAALLGLGASWKRARRRPYWRRFFPIHPSITVYNTSRLLKESQRKKSVTG